MKKDYSDKQAPIRPSTSSEELALKKRRQIVVRFIRGICIVMFLALNYVFWFSPIFKVHSIEINGEYDATLTPSLQSIIEKQYINKQILLTRSATSKSDIIMIVPNLNRYDLIRSLPSKLIVTIIQRQPTYHITQPEKSSFFADKDGYVFSHASPTTSTDSIRIELPTSTSVAIDTFFLSKDALNSLSAYISQLSTLFNIKLTKVSQINNIPDHFNLYSQKRWYIMINARNDVNVTIEALKTFLSEKYQIEANLSYIDLRIPNAVYYK